MTAETLFRRIADYSSRADPYPLYAELREHGGVARQDDGSFLVGTYHEIAALLHDPRISSDRRNRTEYRVAARDAHSAAEGELVVAEQLSAGRMGAPRARIIERLGRYQRTCSPGLTVLVPFVDRLRPLLDR